MDTTRTARRGGYSGLFVLPNVWHNVLVQVFLMYECTRIPPSRPLSLTLQRAVLPHWGRINMGGEPGFILARAVPARTHYRVFNVKPAHGPYASVSQTIVVIRNVPLRHLAPSMDFVWFPVVVRCNSVLAQKGSIKCPIVTQKEANLIVTKDLIVLIHFNANQMIAVVNES